jgi:hypothetical protein
VLSLFAASALFAVMMRFGSNHGEGRMEGMLRQLPGVVQVEVAVRADQPTHRIVHFGTGTLFLGTFMPSPTPTSRMRSFC